MKLIKTLIASLALITALSSCNSAKPGEYSSMGAGFYDRIDIPLEQAWAKTYEILSAKGQVISDDHVQKKMTVVMYGREVKVSMVALNELTTRLDVTSRKGLFPQEANARVVFTELIDGLTK
jgi:hypothetical protein